MVFRFDRNRYLDHSTNGVYVLNRNDMSVEPSSFNCFDDGDWFMSSVLGCTARLVINIIIVYVFIHVYPSHSLATTTT